MKQNNKQRETRVAVRYLWMVLLQWPSLDRTGLSIWYKKSMPVGRSLLSFSIHDNVVSKLSWMVVWEDDEVEVEAI